MSKRSELNPVLFDRSILLGQIDLGGRSHLLLDRLDVRLYCALSGGYPSPKVKAATQAMVRAVGQNYPSTLM